MSPVRSTVTHSSEENLAGGGGNRAAELCATARRDRMTFIPPSPRRMPHPRRFSEAHPPAGGSHLFRQDGARAVEDVAVLVLDVRGEDVLPARQWLEEQEQVVGDGGLERSGHAPLEAPGEAIFAHEEDLRGREPKTERIVKGHAIRAH